MSDDRSEPPPKRLCVVDAAAVEQWKSEMVDECVQRLLAEPQPVALPPPPPPVANATAKTKPVAAVSVLQMMRRAPPRTPVVVRSDRVHVPFAAVVCVFI